MKVVILCGGKGTRLAEETQTKPKPMVQVGEKPIIWHIMRLFDKIDINEFILALGHKGNVIRDYFLNYHAMHNDCRVNLHKGAIDYYTKKTFNWNVNLIDTGEETQTGGRLLRLKPFLKDSTFMLTYGDGVSDVDIKSLLNFHKSHGKIATVTSVRPSARFGEMFIENDTVLRFEEKPQVSSSWINGGFFVFEPAVFDYLKNDETILEREPLERLTAEKQLMAFQHGGFWQCMDTLRDCNLLNKLWESGNAPWA